MTKAVEVVLTIVYTTEQNDRLSKAEVIDEATRELRRRLERLLLADCGCSVISTHRKIEPLRVLVGAPVGVLGRGSGKGA